MRFLKGRHAFLVCTHTDKKHIHNHIYWNSTALDCTQKFKNFIGSYRAVRRLSDLICAEHRLSVVENPQKHGLSFASMQSMKAQSLRCSSSPIKVPDFDGYPHERAIQLTR